MTVITDFKKPIKEDSQRFLFGIALTDTKKFQATFNKVIEIAQGAPAKRDFQGTTIYDFKLPEMPNAGDGPMKNGTASLAIAKDNLFIASEPALLESILRGGAATLADSPEFQAIAKQVPAKSSSLTYARSGKRPLGPLSQAASRAANSRSSSRPSPTLPTSANCSTSRSCPTSPSSPSTFPPAANSKLDGRRRSHLHQLHAPEGQPLIQQKPGSSGTQLDGFRDVGWSDQRSSSRPDFSRAKPGKSG